MSALTQSRVTKFRRATYELRQLAAGAKVFKGGMAMLITSGANAGYYEEANTTDAGVVVGLWAEDVDNTSGSNGTLSANVEYPHEGAFLGLDNDTGGTPVTLAMLGEQCFLLDDHTVTAAANSHPVGTIHDISTDGKVVWVHLPDDGPGPALQSGTGALALGVLTVSTGVTITANSRIFGFRKTKAGTPGTCYDAPSADRTVGGPGTGAFKIRSYESDGTTAETADTSTIDWLIVG